MTADQGRPALMRAIGQSRAGGPDVLRLVEMDRPEPGPTEILVRVHAAGVNPTDWKTRARGRFPVGVLPPFVLGFDVSGVVEAVGDGVTIFKAGDEVYGMPRFPYPAGAYAEFVAAPARHFARKPATLDHVHAAALPLAGLTAWQALVDTAGVRPGERVLIHAAAGGVGHLAVQIAKARGAHVIGTATEAKHDLLRSLGADETIDYTRVDFTEHATGLDVVLDPIGGDTTIRSLRTLRRAGLLVRLPPLTDDRPFLAASELGVRAVRMLVEPDHAGLRSIAELVESGGLRVEIDTVLPLRLAGEAHVRGETGRVAGKIVLSVP